MIQVAFECIGQDSSVTRNRNSTWNSWSKAGIGRRFVTLRKDQGWISASWIYPPSFFFPHMVKTLSHAPVLPISPSKLDWETRNKQQTKRHAFTDASTCMESVPARGVGGACASICVCLNYAHPSRTHRKQAILDASREQVLGENHVPFTGPQEKRSGRTPGHSPATTGLCRCILFYWSTYALLPAISLSTIASNSRMLDV